MTQRRAARLRTAIFATAVACVAYALFWTVTTQLPVVRAAVPFGEDPYDFFSSVAIVLLPLVGGLTALRVSRYGRSGIPDGPVTARVGLGLAICLGLVSAAVVATAIALIESPLEAPSGLARLVVPGLAITAVATVAAWFALGRAASLGRTRRAAAASEAAAAVRPTARAGEPEPDAIDDLLSVLPLPGPILRRLETVAAWARQHRVAAGIGAALAAASAAVIWHDIREGAWASPAAALLYGGILAAILLVAYGLLVVPLRVLRST